jgi:glycosyltransferase involved in cell wall biosynthesis
VNHLALQPTKPGWTNKCVWKLAQVAGVDHPKLTRALSHYSPSLIHAHFGYDAVLVAGAARKLGVPLVVTFHGSDVTYADRYWASQRDPFLRAYPARLRRLFRTPSVHFIAVSDAIRSTAIDKGVPAERIHVCHTGTDVKTYTRGTIPIASRPQKVLFVGRLVSVKGIDVLIRAADRVARTHPDLEVVIVGDGPCRAELERQARGLPIRIEFLGSLSRERAKAHFQDARVLVLPSRTDPFGAYEAFGMVVLEAQACGIPVITSAKGSKTCGILEGETGFSFPENDAEALAERLTRLLSDTQLNQRMADRAPDFVRDRFDLRSCTRVLEDKYLEILDHAVGERFMKSA